MEFLREKHVEYIDQLNRHEEDYEYWLSEHLRLNGMYWGLGALVLLKRQEVFERDEVVRFVLRCYNERDGGFGAFENHDSHLHCTLSALQVLLMCGALDSLGQDRRRKTVAFIRSMQLPDGSFQGDEFGEVDTRFVYSGVQALAILQALDQQVVDGAVAYVLRCRNYDGGFGAVPGSESHAAQAFVCLGTLAICGALGRVDVDRAGWWLSERQLSGGGLNGRPSKLPDVCYSWWVLSSLAIIGRLHWIDFGKLREFILASQDEATGGISDRPDNQVDVFHTFFGIAGLSLMGFEDLAQIDPLYCLPTAVSQAIPRWPYQSQQA